LFDYRDKRTGVIARFRAPRRPCHAVLLECANAPVLTCGPGSAATARCQVLHWKSGHKIGCKRKGRVDFALFNIPSIAK
jgi:hypothetical protein